MAGKAEEISVDEARAEKIITPRLPVDEGIKCKKGKKVRKGERGR